MNECCLNLENRREGSGPRGGEYPPTIQVTHCVVCQCRHLEAEAEPGTVGLRGASL
jgi:hypothetical protein